MNASTTIMEPRPVRVEYVEARRVLLDALTALRGQLDALVLVGAQAVYLRTAGRLPTYQPFTPDADIVLDPARLTDRRRSVPQYHTTSAGLAADQICLLTCT